MFCIKNALVFYKGKRLVKTEKAVCRKTDEPAARFPGKDRRGVSRIKKGVANALIEKIGMKMLASRAGLADE